MKDWAKLPVSSFDCKLPNRGIGSNVRFLQELAALLRYLANQMLVIASVLAFPALVHFWDRPEVISAAVPNNQDAEQHLREMVPPDAELPPLLSRP